ncbi:MAG: FAD-binding protein [Chloroflexi bacterium]|nr:FAD-binding protein [Chloroflexota bacterium]
MAVGTERVIDTHVLIIGGGIAGLLASITARKSGVDVVLASKGPAGRSGSSVVAAGTYLGYEPSDDLAAYVRNACETSHFLDDREMLELIVPVCYELRLRFEGWGLEWEKKDGQFVRKAGLGQKEMRNIYFHGGRQLMSILRGEAVRAGTRIMDRVMVTDLLTSDGKLPTDGKVIGAVGLNVRDGGFYVFRAKSVIMTAGDWGMGEALTGDLTGDGQAATWRAGAQMRSMEQLGYTIAPKRFLSMPGLHPITGHGGRLVNARGERFMEKYHPELLERAPRAVLVQGVAREIKEGRGPVYMDCRHFSKEELARMAQVIPHTIAAFNRVGIDLSRDLVEYVPASNGNVPAGGIRVNKNCETTVDGLFCAGGASDRMYAGLVGLAGASVLGWRAGGIAADYARSSVTNEPKQQQVSEFKNQVYAPLQRSNGTSPRDLFEEVRQIVNERIGVLKHGSRLQEAVQLLELTRTEKLTRIGARDSHTLMRANEMRNIVEMAELIARTSLLRTESRYMNFREDHPERDDINWLKWTIARLEGDGTPKIWTEDIPAMGGVQWR